VESPSQTQTSKLLPMRAGKKEKKEIYEDRAILPGDKKGVGTNSKRIGPQGMKPSANRAKNKHVGGGGKKFRSAKADHCD